MQYRTGCQGLALFILIGILAAGCSSSGRPEVAPAKGVVTHKGKPVGGATVIFNLPGGAARVGEGVTDSEGRFQISTFENNDGAIIGTHDVLVRKLSGQSSQPMQAPTTQEERQKMMSQLAKTQMQDAEKLLKQRKGTTPKVPSEIPEKYGNLQTSGLKAIVSKNAATNDFKLDLVD